MALEQPIGIAPKGVHLRKVNAEYSVWVVGVFGLDFTGAQISQFIEQVNREGSEPVLKIDSPGGFVTDAWNVYDYVRVNGLKFYAEGYGQVSSAATMLLMAASRKRSSVAPNTSMVVHSPYGGSSQNNEQENEKIVNAYVEHTGMSKKEVLALMAEGDAGRVLSAKEAKSYGFVGEILEHQRAAACAMPAEIETTPAMAEKKTAIPVKLTFGKALSAAIGNEVTAEVDVDKAVADEITALKDENTALKQQIATLEAANKEENAGEAAEQEAPTQTTEADAVQAALATAEEKHKAEIEQIKAQAKLDTEAAVKAEVDRLKAPVAKHTVADNQSAAVGSMPGAEPNPNSDFVKQVYAQMTPAQKAQHDARVKANKAAAKQ